LFACFFSFRNFKQKIQMVLLAETVTTLSRPGVFIGLEWGWLKEER
jgi:hypothetical protein